MAQHLAYVKQEDLVLCLYSLMTCPVISPSFASVEPCHNPNFFFGKKKTTHHHFYFLC